MSYGWRLVGDAIADLRELDPSLQEDVLDEMDRVSSDPSILRVTPSGYMSHEIDRSTNEITHLIFIQLHRDDAHERFTVLGIADHVRRR